MTPSLPRLALLCTSVAMLTLSACDSKKTLDTSVSNVAQVPVAALISTDTQIGTGAEALKDHQVSVHYTGWLYDSNAPQFHGKQFDSSRDDSKEGGRPFTFVPGAHQVIPGWDQGVIGMKAGGKRTLIIPSDLAYGERGAGRGLIPSNAPLVFDIELLTVK